MKRKPPTNPTLASFVEAVERTVNPALAAFGFTREQADLKPQSVEYCYGSGTRYVKVSANVDPRDSPSYLNTVIGEGQRSWPEVDWNGVALWRLARACPDAPATISEYLLAPDADIAALVDQMRRDLEIYAADFLRGDLTRFREVRAQVNQEREPYKIHKPVGDGTYRTEVDPTSADLKSRFS
jgi:hypothetical protein